MLEGQSKIKSLLTQAFSYVLQNFETMPQKEMKFSNWLTWEMYADTSKINALNAKASNDFHCSCGLTIITAAAAATTTTIMISSSSSSTF